jgi:DNA-binding transcriptional ArsR family regulator
MMKSPTIFSFTPSLMNPADLESIFVQRETIAADLVDRIRESVLTPTKHHSLIIGAGGMGKTHLVSLVYHRVQAMADVKGRILIAWLREEEWGITSFLKLLLRILRAINPSDPAIQQRIEALHKLPPTDVEQAAMSLLTEIIGNRTLLLITENIYDLFKGLGEQGQQQLRAFLQNSGCCTILATSRYIFKGVQSRTKPFYGFFRPVHLQNLTAVEGVQLLSRIASLRDQKELVSFLQTPTGRSRVRAVQHLIGGNPRFYVIFAEFLSRESLEDLLQPFIELMDALTPYYQSRMMYLSMQQREIIAFLGDHNYPATVRDIAQRCLITSQTTSSQLKVLKEKGYVNVESIGRESFYTLQEPLMRICLGLKKTRDSEPIESMIDFLRAWYFKAEMDLLNQKISDGFIREHLELALQDGNIELVLNGLLQQDSSQWKARITDLINWFESFPVAVTNGLVSACKKMISPLISDTTATLWHDTWHELTHHLPEYQLSLRLLTTALHYRQKPDDPRVWMELSIEERKILQQALGIDSIESRD